jgi:hypothetical protein
MGRRNEGQIYALLMENLDKGKIEQGVRLCAPAAFYRILV